MSRHKHRNEAEFCGKRLGDDSKDGAPGKVSANQAKIPTANFGTVKKVMICSLLKVQGNNESPSKILGKTTRIISL